MRKIMIAGEKYIKDGVEKTKWYELGVIGEKDGKEYFIYNKTLNLSAFGEPGKLTGIASIFSQDNQQGQGYSQSNGMNNPSPRQQGGYNQQQGVPAQHLPNQNQNTQGNGYQQPQQQGYPPQQDYDANGNPVG